MDVDCTLWRGQQGRWLQQRGNLGRFQNHFQRYYPKVNDVCQHSVLQVPLREALTPTANCPVVLAGPGKELIVFGRY